MAKPSVFPIKPKDIDGIWPVLSKYIEESMQYGLRTHDLEDVLECVKNASMVLWAVMSEKSKICGVAVTAVFKEPKVRICVVRWLGGYDINTWFETSHRVLASWARMNGCDVLRHDGRRGWMRYLKPYGYKEVASTALLDLRLKPERAESCQVAAADKHPQLR